MAHDVDSLFAAPAACPTSETWRYASLMALHPGAKFHRALLEADREEELLLSKVYHHIVTCMITDGWHISGICHLGDIAFHRGQCGICHI